MTVIVYISRNEEMPQDYRDFLAWEIKCENAAVLEYRKEEGKGWQKDAVLRICSDLAETVFYQEYWELLVVDDRRKRIPAESLYGGGYFLWDLLDCFNRAGAGWGYTSAAPSAVYMLSTVDLDPCVCNGGTGEKRGKQGKKWNFLCPIRFFAFNFDSGDGKLYEKKEMQFAMILLELSMYGLRADDYSYNCVYWIRAEWSEKEARGYITRMRVQYGWAMKEIEKKRDCMPKLLDRLIFADINISMLPGDDGGTVPTRYLSGTLNRYDKVIRGIENEIEYKAEREFEKIRSATYYRDTYGFEEEEIKRRAKEYEDALTKLYLQDAWPPGVIRERLEELKARKKERGGRTIWLTAVMIIQFAAAWVIVVAASSGEQILQGWTLPKGSIPVMTTGALGIFVWFLYNNFSLGRELKREKDEIRKNLYRMEYRIGKELSYMANYRHVYHIHNVLRTQQEKLKEQNESLIFFGEQLEGKIRMLDRISRLIQPENRDAENAADGIVWSEDALEESDLYYPVNWEQEKSLGLPSGQDVHFPFPYIKTVRTETVMTEKGAPQKLYIL